MDRILSSGTGRGRIAFFDLRANDYRSVHQKAMSPPQTQTAPQSYYNPGEDIWHNSIYNGYDDYEDYYDEDYTDSDFDYEDSDVSDDNDVSVHHDFNQDSSDNDDDNEAVGNGANLSTHDVPARQHQPSGPPSYRRPMPGPTALALQHAQSQVHDFGMTAKSNSWLQTGKGWLDHNDVYR